MIRNIFFRFVGDDFNDNEITDHKTRKITSSDDLGFYVSEQMTWTPSIADFCNFDATVSSILSLFSECWKWLPIDRKKCKIIFQSVSCKDAQFIFSLICKVEQNSPSGSYYQNENDQQLAEVVVEVSSFSWRTTTSNSLQ